jgi:hypothetical protein
MAFVMLCTSNHQMDPHARSSATVYMKSYTGCSHSRRYHLTYIPQKPMTFILFCRQQLKVISTPESLLWNILAECPQFPTEWHFVEDKNYKKESWQESTTICLFLLWKPAIAFAAFMHCATASTGTMLWICHESHIQGFTFILCTRTSATGTLATSRRIGSPYPMPPTIYIRTILCVHMSHTMHATFS